MTKQVSNETLQSQVRELIEGEQGVYEVDPCAPDDFLQSVIDNDGPGSLYAQWLLTETGALGSKLKLE